MSEASTIIAVGAHAADMEFTAGATLLKHVRAGWSGHIVHLTLGEKGSAKLSTEQYGAQKQREAEEAARLLNCTPHFFPFADGELTVDDEIASALAELFRKLQPNVIIAHWRDSIHADHTASYHLTRRAFFMAANPHFNFPGLSPVRGARTYYADNWEDPDNFQPYIYVDISDVFSDWERAFKSYAIGRGEGGFPYWDWYQARTRIHGIAIGVKHAEAFAVDTWRMKQTRELL